MTCLQALVVYITLNRLLQKLAFVSFLFVYLRQYFHVLTFHPSKVYYRYQLKNEGKSKNNENIENGECIMELKLSTNFQKCLLELQINNAE